MARSPSYNRENMLVYTCRYHTKIYNFFRCRETSRETDRFKIIATYRNMAGAFALHRVAMYSPANFLSEKNIFVLRAC